MERYLVDFDGVIINSQEKFESHMRNIFQKDFCSLIVYGSYARGDYNDNSDIVNYNEE